jgi:hypothetical protein
MTEREAMLVHLEEFVGIDRQEAEARLLDDDLWILDPGGRYVLEGEEGIQQWREAAEFIGSLADGANNSGAVNQAATMILTDAALRCEEALRRVKERAGAP